MEKMTLSSAQKPPRTFGLALAIILSIIYFSVLPLIANGYTVLLKRHFENVGESCFDMGPDVEPVCISGMEGAEVNYWQVLLAVIFFVVAVFAWRGKPPSIRFIFMFAIIGVTIFNLGLTFSIPAPDPATQGFDSSTGMAQVLANAQLFGSFLVVLYVLWYTNRGPARAFYRGYYLQEPVEEKQK
jgi:hypothetical protein